MSQIDLRTPSWAIFMGRAKVRAYASNRSKLKPTRIDSRLILPPYPPSCLHQHLQSEFPITLISEEFHQCCELTGYQAQDDIAHSNSEIHARSEVDVNTGINRSKAVCSSVCIHGIEILAKVAVYTDRRPHVKTDGTKKNKDRLYKVSMLELEQTYASLMKASQSPE